MAESLSRPMNKYAALFAVSWQKQLEVRSNFLFERIRSVSILVSLYFLWSALLSNQNGILGYSRDQMLTYVFLMTLLRAFVLACVSDYMPSDIARGKLSDVLLRPISNVSWWAVQDGANKALNLLAAVFEVGLFILLLQAPFVTPESVLRWGLFLSSVALAMVLYFQFSYLLGVMGFWTAQSWGPRFCFEIVLEFCAGAYFPIDILPSTFQAVLRWLPFPYLIFEPASIFLGRSSMGESVATIGIQLAWIAVLAVIVRIAWRKGLRKYGAEGR